MSDLVWFAGVTPALVVEFLRSIGCGEVGLDIVAALSMTAALAFGETFAAAVVAVMYSGGTFLEGFAKGRARRKMHDLLSRVRRTATRHRNGGLLQEVIDVAVILNALRAWRIKPEEPNAPDAVIDAVSGTLKLKENIL